jgi:archaellum biogenesis ATPase FlaH
MEKQSKLIKYMKPKTEGGEIFESSDMDIDSMDNKMPGNEKKQTNMINFLRKFDQAALDVMEKYLNDNKYFLELPTKPKISLYEDVVIIVEYWKAFESLKKDRTKTVEQLCEKLQPIIKRSKVTIKERISKKLCRCSVEEVLEAIKNKKDLSFDKNEKAKKNNQNTE